MGLGEWLFRFTWIFMLVIFYAGSAYWLGYTPLQQPEPLIDHECCLGICQKTYEDCFDYSNLRKTVTCSPFDLNTMHEVYVNNVTQTCYVFWEETFDPFKQFGRQGCYVEKNVSSA